MVTPQTNPVMLKLQWAEKRLRELDNILAAYRSQPQAIFIELDAKKEFLMYRLKHDPVIQPDIPLLAGDIFQGLRSALDYLANALVIANGKKPTRNTCFPISEQTPLAKGYEAAFAGKVAGMRQDAIDRIKSVKPYKGGNPYLWPVHELNNRDKHRLLFTVGAYLSGFGLSQHIDATRMPLEQIERMGRALFTGQGAVDIRRATYPLKAGDILLIETAEAIPDYDAQFFIQVALDEAGIFEGEPLHAVVWQGFHEIVRVIGQFRGAY
jgi:hypothetical protein